MGVLVPSSKIERLMLHILKDHILSPSLNTGTSWEQEIQNTSRTSAYSLSEVSSTMSKIDSIKAAKKFTQTSRITTNKIIM